LQVYASDLSIGGRQFNVSHAKFNSDCSARQYALDLAHPGLNIELLQIEAPAGKPNHPVRRHLLLIEAQAQAIVAYPAINIHRRQVRTAAEPAGVLVVADSDLHFNVTARMLLQTDTADPMLNLQALYVFGGKDMAALHLFLSAGLYRAEG